MRSGDDGARAARLLCAELCGVVEHFRPRDLAWHVFTTLGRKLNLNTANSAVKSRGSVDFPSGETLPLTPLGDLFMYP